MIVISFLLMLVLFIIAGATQFWLLAMIGVGIFVITLLTYLMATNDIFGAIVIMLLAIGAPIIYLKTEQSWILYVIYIAIGLWINAGTITDNDVYIEWTFEGKIYEFFDEKATDFLINLYSFICAAIWGGLAFIATKFLWFLLIPSLYLVVRSIIILAKSSNYSLTHSFSLFEDIGNFFRSFGNGVKNFFVGGRYSGRRFSWLTFLLPIILIGLSCTLVYFERNNAYSNFGKTLEICELFSITEWFHFTSAIWEWIPEVCEELSDALPFFGDILSLPLGLLLLIFNLFVAIIECFLSLIWVIICLLVDELFPFIIGFFLIYIVPVLLPLGLLILLILSFTLNHSTFNRLWMILLFLLGAVGCYYYFVFMSGGTPIIPLPI